MNAKRAWKFKNELLRYGRHKSKHLCWCTHRTLHHASLGIAAAAACPALQPVPAPKTSFCSHGAGTDAPPWRCRRPPKSAAARPPTPADFGSSQRCEWQRASTATSQTLSQPGFDKSLPITCSLPGNTLVGFAKSGTQIYGDDGTFHLFIYFSSPPSPVLYPNSPGL